MNPRTILALATVLALAACASTPGPNPVPATLQVATEPGTRSITAGSQASVNVTATPHGGFSGTVELSATVNPAEPGIGVSPLDAWSIQGSASRTRTFTITVAGNVEPGAYSLTIDFTLAGASVEKASVDVTVLAADGEPDPDPDVEWMIATGDSFVLVLTSSGEVWGWGTNFNGQLGTPEGPGWQPVATRIAGLPARAAAIDAGWQSSHALLEDGTIWTWGLNHNGQLGQGLETRSTHVPGPVMTDAGPDADAMIGFARLSVGHTSVTAWTGDGAAWNWGRQNARDPDTSEWVSARSPVAAAAQLGGSHVGSVVHGTGFALSVTEDGTVWAAGDGKFGQLGTGETYGPADTVQTDPLKVALPAGAKARQVAAGTIHALALLEDGTVWSWGMNLDGRLGRNGDTLKPGRVDLDPDTRAMAVAAGNSHSLALLEDGTVMAWGSNTMRQLGPEDPNHSFAPVEVDLPGPAVQVLAGEYHSLAVLEDGTIWTWGLNWLEPDGSDAVPQKTPPPTGPIEVPRVWLEG